MTHTPGPWAYADGSNVVSTTAVADWSDPDDVQPQQVLCVYGAMGGEDTGADLALIVAAPELLDMCERLFTQVTPMYQDPLLEEARELIDRAKDYAKMRRIE